MNRPRSLKNTSEAADFFEKALVLQPELPQALLGLGRATILKVTSRWSLDRVVDTSKADGLVTRALFIRPDYAKAQFVKGEIFRARNDFDNALSMYDEAVQ